MSQSAEKGNFQQAYLAMCVFMYVYAFAIGAFTLRATGLKFGTELGLHSEKVIAIMQAGTHPGGDGGPKSGSRQPTRWICGKTL